MRIRLIILSILILLFAFSATGNAQEPVTVAFVSKVEEGSTAYDAWLALMSNTSGLPMTWLGVTDTNQAMTALCSGQAAVARLTTFEYLVATQQGCATIVLIGVGNLNAFMRSQIIVRADSGITSIADLKGKTFCRPSEKSIIGWRMPLVMLRAGGVNPDTDFAELRTVTGSAEVVRMVYEGSCAAGATIVDGRRSLLTAYPDVLERVSVLQVSTSIPRDVVAINPNVPEDTRNRIVNALLDTILTPANAQLYQSLFGWNQLLVADDRLFDDLRQQMTQGGLALEDFIQ